MQNCTVLATFSHLIGNATIKALLEQMVARGSLPPVLLFYGPAGVGKTLFAKVLGERLTQTTKKEAPDIHILTPEGKARHHPVETIREMVAEVGLPPFEAACKVFVMEDADRMLATSSNALLKVLEEPAPETYIILTTSDLSKMLPTIVSRCCKMQFFPISEEEICQFLIKHLLLAEEASRKIALLSEGSLGKALFIAKHPHRKELDELLQASDYPELFASLAKLDDALDLSEEDEDEKAKQVDVIFEEILYWVREKHPSMLEKAIVKIAESRMALAHHLKLKTILEHFFLSIRS